MATRRSAHATLFVATLAALAAGLTPGCLETREDADTSVSNECATCHGDTGRDGDKLRKSAPPRDLNGNSGDPAFPGVGSHEIHLSASSTHAAIACAECHLVPKATGDKGHADSDRPAELVFATGEGTIAKNGDRNPSYDPGTRKCSDSYCHRGSDATWTKPRSSAEACGSCHGLPPPPPHVIATPEQCVLCHGNVVDAEMQIIAPDKHVNGEVDLVGTTACSACHGDPERAGDDLRKAAPPKDLAGNKDPSGLGVGAHDVHLSGGKIGGPIPCGTCHVVPTNFEDPGHADTPHPAEIVFSGVALSGGHKPSWDRETKKCSDVWCHGASAASAPPTQEWTDATDLGCTSCHGLPPPFPHPQMPDCVRCHADTVDAALSIVDKSKHVNGTVDVQPKTGCTDCHGTPAQNAAPPVDLAGKTATTEKSVGAHQSHLKPNGPFRPVPCNECHVVPVKWDDVGHIDTMLPAELTFSGVATAWKAAPKFENGKCENTYCHGAVTPLAPPSGDYTVPEWTKVEGKLDTCGTYCHGFPPLAPHPQGAGGCDGCHKNLTGFTFNKPETHVDGEVTFTVP